MNVQRELARLRAPDEHAAQARAWEIVRSAYREQTPQARQPPSWRLALAPAVIAVVAALALGPAGATVSRLIGRAIGIPHPVPALFALPAPGELLVSGSGGTWIVSTNGSRRRLGSWRQASWSPRGRYVAVASGETLAAVTPRGATQWALSRPAVSDPRWYPPTGFRVAYRSGSSVRVVAGDGSGDHLLAAGVAPIAPAWRPGHPYELAYVWRHRVVLRDADSGQLIWTRPAGVVLGLDWSSDGSRLLILARSGARVLAGNGSTTATVEVRPANPVRTGSLSPNGRTLALVRAQGVAVARLSSPRPTVSSVLSGAGVGQVTWSPNGRWLLVSWPTADEWVFLAVGDRPRLAAVSRIAQQFHQARANQLPRLEGWCCSVQSPPG